MPNVDLYIYRHVFEITHPHISIKETAKGICTHGLCCFWYLFFALWWMLCLSKSHEAFAFRVSFLQMLLQNSLCAVGASRHKLAIHGVVHTMLCCCCGKMPWYIAENKAFLQTARFATNGTRITTFDKTMSKRQGWIVKAITKDRYVQQSINTIIHTRKYSQMNHRPFIFHGIGKSRQQTHYKVVQGGVGGEYTASLFYDIIHGHDRRWLVRSHLAATMGFAV